MKTIGKIFLTGLATIAPVGVTVYVLYWLGSTAESLLRPVVPKLLPDIFSYSFGMGIAVAVLAVFVVGVLMNFWLIRVVWGWGEKLLERIPLVKTLYGSVRDLMGFFGTSDKKQQLNQVVMVNVGNTDVRLIGLLTREDFSDLPQGVGSKDTVAVYLPMSYQIGGFTTMVPRSAVEPVDMSMEEAMRFAVTAGMSGVKEGTARVP